MAELQSAIVELKSMLERDFNSTDEKRFNILKEKLGQESPVNLKNKISILSYGDYSEPFLIDEYDNYKPLQAIRSKSDILKLIRFYEEKIFEISTPSNPEDLYKQKLLKAKNTGFDFYQKLGEMVVGDTPNFPYRSSKYITLFFKEAGYPFLRHNSDTRRFWAAEQLETMSLDDLYNIIKCLFKRKYFDSCDGKADIGKAKESLKTLINSCCQEDDFEDIAEIFDLNINTSLLFNQHIETSDTLLNADIGQARNFYIKGDMQMAVEKIWDAFERIKSLFNEDKKTSVSLIVDSLSDEIKSSNSSSCIEKKNFFFDQEMKRLTEIGNSYKIRHSEQNQCPIINLQTKEYLFFAVLNLVNLIYYRMNFS